MWGAIKSRNIRAWSPIIKGGNRVAPHITLPPCGEVRESRVSQILYTSSFLVLFSIAIEQPQQLTELQSVFQLYSTQYYEVRNIPLLSTLLTLLLGPEYRSSLLPLSFLPCCYCCSLCLAVAAVLPASVRLLHSVLSSLFRTCCSQCCLNRVS